MISFLIRRCVSDSDNLASPEVHKACAKLCSGVGVLLNLLLFAVKLCGGLISGSAAIVADGVNNLSDAASSVAVFAGFCLAGIGAGENHRFGHGRYEWLMGILSSAAVVSVGAALAGNSLTIIRNPRPVAFSLTLLTILICSALVKFYMYRYNRTIGGRIASAAMSAAAADSLSDMVSTLAIAVSLIAERINGWHIDGWCSLIVSLLIIFSGLKSMMEAVERLMGRASDRHMEEVITGLALKHPEVHGLGSLLIHDYGMGCYAVSLHIEGRAGESGERLSAVAQELQYELYEALGCEAVVQADLLITAPEALDAVTEAVRRTLDGFEETAKLKSLRLAKGFSHTNVLVTVSGSRRLQKQSQALRLALQTALTALDPTYRLIPTVLITYLNPQQ